jgi:hypothetical protein
MHIGHIVKLANLIIVEAIVIPKRISIFVNYQSLFMKIILSLLLLIISSGCFSQTTTTFYFDKYMNVVPKGEAVISGTGEMGDGLYKVTCY